MSISRDSMIRIPSPTELQSATTSNPGSACSSRETPSRNNAWSSMSSKRTVFAEVLFIGAIFLVTSSGETDSKTAAFFARLKSQLAQVAATLPLLLKQLAQQYDLLAALSGGFPNQDLPEKFELSSLQLPQELPLSLPSQLVDSVRMCVKRRRSCIRRARRLEWRSRIGCQIFR